MEAWVSRVFFPHFPGGDRKEVRTKNSFGESAPSRTPEFQVPSSESVPDDILYNCCSWGGGPLVSGLYCFLWPLNWPGWKATTPAIFITQLGLKKPQKWSLPLDCHDIWLSTTNPNHATLQSSAKIFANNYLFACGGKWWQ